MKDSIIKILKETKRQLIITRGSTAEVDNILKDLEEQYERYN